MDANIHEGRGPLSFRHQVHEPLPKTSTCYLWFKITEADGSEIGICFDKAASLRSLAAASSQAAELLEQAQRGCDSVASHADPLTMPLITTRPDQDGPRRMAEAIGLTLEECEQKAQYEKHSDLDDVYEKKGVFKDGEFHPDDEVQIGKSGVDPELMPRTAAFLNSTLG